MKVTDRSSFHESFEELLGFPGWYGANMDAWIDCMSNLDDAESGIIGFKLDAGETLVIGVAGTESFPEQIPDVFADFVTCTAFVNQRYLKRVGKPIVTLAFL